MNDSWWTLIPAAAAAAMDNETDRFETEICNATGENVNISSVIEDLISKTDVCFKSQQRDESDMNIEDKRTFATQLFDKSKYLFLVQFGRHMNEEHLEYFKRFEEGDGQSYEIKAALCDLKGREAKVKNRRYEALRRIARDGTYFSDLEMMKREPLLYEQLVGQYLSKDERRKRDENTDNDTLVKLLLEGIEQDRVFGKMLKQLEEENMEEQDSDEDCGIVEMQDIKASKSKWGEFEDAGDYTIKKNSFSAVKREVSIAAGERRLLRNEFVSIMHQKFLEGKEDFDYSTVDDNDDYDSMDILGHDAEDTYFDSEEPEDLQMDTGRRSREESSEDELDIYMNALNQHPTVISLSKDMERL